MGAAGALTGAPKAPKGGAPGATPPEGEGNLASGGSSRVLPNKIYQFQNILKIVTIIQKLEIGKLIFNSFQHIAHHPYKLDQN